MTETFEEYKKTLEKALVETAFFYSGDVVKSCDTILYSEDKSNGMMSPDFIIKSFSEVYKKTMEKFFSNEYNYVVSSIDGKSRNKSQRGNLLSEKLEEFKAISNSSNIYYRFVIAPLTSYNKIGASYITQKNRPLPDYFYSMFGLSISSPSNFNFYYTPQGGYFNFPEESEDTHNIWIVDKPIQSLLWTIQNMDYQIEYENNIYRHTMSLPIYECQYNVLNIKLRNIKKFRDRIIGGIID